MFERSFSVRILIFFSWLTFFAGCSAPPVTTHTGSAPPPPEEIAAFEEAEAAWVGGDIAEAGRRFESFLERYPSSLQRGEALVYAGRCAARHGDDARARGHYEAALRSRDRRVVARAHLELGHGALITEQFGEAARHFHAAGSAAGEPETRGEALLKEGIALQKQGQFERARPVLEACVRQAPTTELVNRARQQLEHESFFFVQLGSYREESNARAQLARMDQRGFEGEVNQRLAGDGSIRYKVVSGRFDKRWAAVSHRDRLHRALGGEKPLVIP